MIFNGTTHHLSCIARLGSVQHLFNVQVCICAGLITTLNVVANTFICFLCL